MSLALNLAVILFNYKLQANLRYPIIFLSIKMA